MKVAKARGVKVFIRAEIKKNLPALFKPHAIENTYVANPIVLIDKKFDNNNFKKEKNKTIIIDESKILLNEYSLAISKEKMNNLYIDILNTMKNDEIILKKIDEIQSIVDKFDFISEEKISLKDEFNQNIEDLIEEINKNNIGSEEICISIYEYKGETIGISIPLMDKQIDLKCYTKDGYSNSEISITSQNNILRQIALKGNEKETIVYIEDNEKNKPTKLEIKNIKDTNNNTTIVYEIEKAKLEINLNRFVEAVDDITDKIKFNSDNSGQIDTLDDERFNQLNELLKNEFDKQYTELKGVIDITDLENILYKIGLSKEATILEMSGDITETQKNRFNSKFEFLQGMELNGERILQEIEIFKENIRDFHVISNDVMEIEVDRISGENEKIIHLQDFIGKDRNRKYNLELKYDEETGLVKFIVMTIVRKK
ncbi:MAG: hypothetical protein HUJ68_12060 [Clostridia bacterium]|nr:hypothetical protein [Clostridia bacterium]